MSKVHRAFTKHRQYDNRMDAVLRQFNEFVESEVMPVKDHAILRPLIESLRDIIRDSLEEDLAPSLNVHRRYDDRVDAVLRQFNEFVEQGMFEVRVHSVVRPLIETMRNIARDAIEDSVGAGED